MTNAVLLSDVSIRTDLRPGDLGGVVWLHGKAYRDDEAHFGLTFEAYVAKTIAEFMIENKGRGEIFLAEYNGNLVGCSAMVERRRADETVGQLRWVLTVPEVRGIGLGKKLVHLAVDHARQKKWSKVFLETTEGLDASMGIYERMGFKVVSQETDDLWRGDTTVITMELEL